MSSVLLTYGWVRSSYSALWNLAKHDLDVVVSTTLDSGCASSQGCHPALKKYTSHYRDESKFIEDLIEICRLSKDKLILPSHNETK